MTNSKHSSIKFYIFATVTLAGCAFIAAGFGVPRAISYARSESVRYTVSALNGQGTEAELNFRLAYALDGTNQSAALGLARTYLANGQTNEAMMLLDRIGDNHDGLRLKLQALTEAGQFSQAKSTADKLAKGSNEGDIVLAAALYTLGGFTNDLNALDGRLSSVEALQAMSRLHAGDLPQALELRSLGLPVSARTLLVKLPPSTARSISLGQILLQQGDNQSLAAAADYLSAAIKLDPANIEARQIYSHVLRTQKNVAAADDQERIIMKLKQGKF